MTSDHDGDWVFDPALAGMNRRIQNEFRQEAQAVEADTRDYEERSRTVSDWVLEARNRGDVLRVQTRLKVFTGTVAYAAGDFLTLSGPDFEADIAVNAIASVRIVEHGRRGGAPLPEGPGTFEMRLVERRGTTQVELGQVLLDEILGGRLVAVGKDHLILEIVSRQEVVVPLSNVTWLVSRRRGR